MNFGSKTTLNCVKSKLVHNARIAKDVGLIESDEAHVLHCTNVEFGAEDLIVLGKGVLARKELLIKSKTLLGDLKQLGVIEVFAERAAAVQPERNAATVKRILEALIRSRHHGEQIRRYGFGWRKRVSAERRATHLDAGTGSRTAIVTENLPIRGRRYMQREAGLDVRLIKARQQSMRKKGLEIRVQILQTIDGIDKLMKSVTAMIVIARILNTDKKEAR